MRKFINMTRNWEAFELNCAEANRISHIVFPQTRFERATPHPPATTLHILDHRSCNRSCETFGAEWTRCGPLRGSIGTNLRPHECMRYGNYVHNRISLQRTYCGCKQQVKISVENFMVHRL